MPDTKASTAGIHVAKVLKDLGIAGKIANQLRVIANGATAMRTWLCQMPPSARLHAVDRDHRHRRRGAVGRIAARVWARDHVRSRATRASATPQAQRLITLLTAPDAWEFRSRASFVVERI
ncbi:hypothetical protein MTX26_24485 [Bradyrhizobium sp. ISRA443]|uniref:hypothetical protein n=1 Tax=unclassified Bradyrhizobium TaxID=2631580 RepID=UPI00247970C8|nr:MULTISPECIES: hypothetical protein [unclassified Bradyrhizobium]WGR93052.1 hypothetical protein MTX20_35405 [Bradyrhizobium sp. ISRA435]WGR97552.1 hypothetical protein MTX23_24480 [Bradyrhizobium sp. ISRA436]WGS04442.1 hypothetical protein MTX18_24485 [Bradyrhizobium sp. ISRA437]WGS11323.1 hypothetical protein MTX26_24485 [Bradyrhizobium sp. ISRA443]